MTEQTEQIIRERLRVAADALRASGYVQADADIGHLLAEIARLRAALERLGDGSGFVAIGLYPDDQWGREVQARIAYARKALKVKA